MGRPHNNEPIPPLTNKPKQVVAYSRNPFDQPQIPILFDPRVSPDTIEFRDLEGRLVGSIVNIRNEKQGK